MFLHGSAKSKILIKFIFKKTLCKYNFRRDTMVPFKYVILYSKLNDFWAFILEVKIRIVCVCVCVCVCVVYDGVKKG